MPTALLTSRQWRWCCSAHRSWWPTLALSSRAWPGYLQGAFVQEDEKTGESQLCLVTEYMEGGSLQANLRQGRVTWYKHGKRVSVQLGA